MGTGAGVVAETMRRDEDHDGGESVLRPAGHGWIVAWYEAIYPVFLVARGSSAMFSDGRNEAMF